MLILFICVDKRLSIISVDNNHMFRAGNTMLSYYRYYRLDIYTENTSMFHDLKDDK